MTTDSFPLEVAERLRWYVYRLIDPRNGETFYVGKGRGNRVFEHVKRNVTADPDEDEIDLKIQRIIDIGKANLPVLHVIHRHNIENEEIAYEIEAALIEAYPGLSNKVSGHGTGDYGCRHVDQIISEYRALAFEPYEPLILISISKSYDEDGKDIYDAVRGVWRTDINRARRFKLVLAHRRGLVVGAFRPTIWLPATKANFPWLEADISGRCGFEGVPAEVIVADNYIGKRVPEKFRTRGASNPVRFVEHD